MTAAVINQLIRSGFSLKAMKSMAGPNAGKWKSFVNSALGYGYGAGEIIDFMQANEDPSKTRFREKIDARRSRGMATPEEEAAYSDAQARPGQSLSQAATRAAPLAAAMNIPGLFGGQAQQQQPTEPIEPIAPQSANAIPQNAQNRLAGMMKAHKGKSPLNMESLKQQSTQRRLGEMQSRASQSLRESVSDIAPTVFEQAQALVQRMSPEEASLQIRKSAKRTPAIAKEISRLRRERGLRLEDVIAQEFQAGAQAGTQAGAQAGTQGVDQILAELNQILGEL